MLHYRFASILPAAEERKQRSLFSFVFGLIRKRNHIHHFTEPAILLIANWIGKKLSNKRLRGMRCRGRRAGSKGRMEQGKWNRVKNGENRCKAQSAKSRAQGEKGTGLKRRRVLGCGFMIIGVKKVNEW